MGQKKKLAKFIKKIVKKEVKKQLEKQRTDIISEVLSYVENKSFSGGEDNYETDDPVLQRVMEKNKKKKENDPVEQALEEDHSRDPETIREKILQVQQNAQDQGGQQMNPMHQPGAQQPAGPQSGGMGDPRPNPSQQAGTGHQQQRPQGQTPNPANPAQGGQQGPGGEPEIPSQDEFTPSNPQQARNQHGQQQTVDPNRSDVPDYLQNAANRDYSELVDRFGD